MNNPYAAPRGTSMRIPRDDLPPCTKRPDLFASTNKADHVHARTYCLGNAHQGTPACPTLAWCRGELAKAQRANQAGPSGGPEGTWAGIFLPKRERAGEDS